jgi:hypothetical protein
MMFANVKQFNRATTPSLSTRRVTIVRSERKPSPAAQALEDALDKVKEPVKKATGIDPTAKSSEVDVTSGRNTTATNVFGRTQGTQVQFCNVRSHITTHISSFL